MTGVVIDKDNCLVCALVLEEEPGSWPLCLQTKPLRDAVVPELTVLNTVHRASVM